MHEKPPGEALTEMDAIEPGGAPRRPNAAAAGAILAGIISGVLGALLAASKSIHPLPPSGWYALVAISGITALLALLGFAKSRVPATAGRKRSLFALALGLGGIALSFTIGSEAFFPKPLPPTPAPAPRRVGTTGTRRATTSRSATSRTISEP